MNKHKIILSIGFILLLCACNNKSRIKIKGHLTSAADKTLYLQELGIDSTFTIDSVKLNKKGAFNFSLPKVKYPTFYLLKLSEKNFITLLADSTEKIEIVADANNLNGTYSVKNSMGSAYIKTLNRKLEITKNKVDSIVSLYKATDPNNTNVKNIIREELSNVIQNQKDFITDFVLTNPSSFASYYAVFQRFDDETLILNTYDKRDLNIYSAVATSLIGRYPESPRVKQLKSYILGIKQEQRQAQLLAKINTETEVAKIPEIEEKDINGKVRKLSSLKGKMVLLSFWASWDKRSRNENQRLVKIYNKYKSKGFEVYQVSLDRSKILWEAAIEQDQLPWINVSDLRYTNSYPARIYNIKQIPANYLISENSEIIGKNLFGKILDDKLNDLLY
jgi:peroxiredoxin